MINLNEKKKKRGKKKEEITCALQPMAIRNFGWNVLSPYKTGLAQRPATSSKTLLLPWAPRSEVAVAKMSSLAVKIIKFCRIRPSAPSAPNPFFAAGVLRSSSACCYSTASFDSENEEVKNDVGDKDFDDFLGGKPELQPQGVDPRKGWGFRGVHKAIICGKVGQAPVQKILRNGRTVTIFTVGTGGMFDQRIVGARDLPKPAQWHRIAVHNDSLGAYAVQQLVKNSSVYVEGDIETRVYNDSINGEVKNVPEVCVRRDGRIRLIKTGESVSNISFDELREGLL